jgi:hypothetical protein
MCREELKAVVGAHFNPLAFSLSLRIEEKRFSLCVCNFGLVFEGRLRKDGEPVEEFEGDETVL